MKDVPLYRWRRAIKVEMPSSRSGCCWRRRGSYAFLQLDNIISAYVIMSAVENEEAALSGAQVLERSLLARSPSKSA